jgi:hypothetical protein
MVVGVGWAWRPPAVGFHPVRDRVFASEGTVVAQAETPSDLGGEHALVVGTSSGQASPPQRADQFGDSDRFGIGRGEEAGDAEGVGFRSGRDQHLGAAVPVVPGVAVGTSWVSVKFQR